MSEATIERLTRYSDEDAIQLGALMPFLSSRFTAEPVKEELLTTIINSPLHTQLVARLDGKIVGAATLSVILGAAMGKKGCLEDFVVDSSVQRHGIGGKLWQEMIDWYSEQGVRSVEFTSGPSRTAAHRFYYAHGATVRDTSVFHLDML